MDVLFVIDSSGSVTESFRNQLAEANRVVDRMIVGPNNARVGLIVYADPGRAKTEIALNEIGDKSQLQSRISQTKYIGGTTGSSDALRLAARELTPERGLRNHARKVVIMFTDGMAQQDPKAEAQAVQQRADEVYAVSTGPYANLQQLIDISGDERRSFKRDTLPDFERAMDRLFAQCR